MFDGKKYITKGVESEIPLWVQNFLWFAVEAMPEPRDYLQVFNLSTDCGKQKITHTQEQPEYRQEYSIPAEDAVTAKVYIIDDGDHYTMLLAGEY